MKRNQTLECSPQGTCYMGNNSKEKRDVIATVTISHPWPRKLDQRLLPRGFTQNKPRLPRLAKDRDIGSSTGLHLHLHPL